MSFWLKFIMRWTYKFDRIDFLFFKSCSISTYFSVKIRRNFLINRLSFYGLRLTRRIEWSTTAKSLSVFAQFPILWYWVGFFLFLFKFKVFLCFVKLYFIWVQFFMRFILICVTDTSKALKFWLAFKILWRVDFWRELNFIKTFKHF